MKSMMEASVVDLPEPTDPVTRMIPFVKRVSGSTYSVGRLISCMVNTRLLMMR